MIHFCQTPPPPLCKYSPFKLIRRVGEEVNTENTRKHKSTKTYNNKKHNWNYFKLLEHLHWEEWVSGGHFLGSKTAVSENLVIFKNLINTKPKKPKKLVLYYY